MLLTATPIVNYPNDIAPLVNIVKMSDELPVERDLFHFMYFNEDSGHIHNEKLLKNKLSDCISFYQNKKDDDYPSSKMIYKEVVMNKEQIDEYGKFVTRFIYDYQVPVSTNLYDIQFDYLKRSKRNSFLTATRMISNTVNGAVDTPKIKELFNELISGEYPAVIYSNFLENGVYTIAKLIANAGISFKMITGKTDPDKLKQIVNNFNDGKFQVLLLSSAGSESLTLKGVRQLHIMEPAYNEARIEQVIGRTIRYKSHEKLPKNKRHVNIFRWISVFPKPLESNMSADQYLVNLSKKKEEITNRFKKIVIDAAIENDPKYSKIIGQSHKINRNYYDKYIKYKTKYLQNKNL